MGVDGVAGTSDKDGRRFLHLFCSKRWIPEPALVCSSMLGSELCEITVRMLRCWACSVRLGSEARRPPDRRYSGAAPFSAAEIAFARTGYQSPLLCSCAVTAALWSS